MKDYVKNLREKVGHDPIFLNAASGLVVDSEGRVLLERRGRGEKANSWSIPGGIMELGERPQDTVRRELYEETGLQVEVGTFIGVYTTPDFVKYPNGDVCQMVTQVFECKIMHGEIHPDNDETLELRYFTLKDRPQLFRPHLECALKDYEAGRFGVSG